MLVSVPPDTPPTRLDRFLADRDVVHSRAFAQKLIREGLVQIDGVPVKASHKVSPGEEISVEIPAPEPSHLLPEDIPLDIIHMDEDIVVVNKQAGLVVHPGVGARTGTLVHALLHHVGRIDGGEDAERPGIVHRLDKDTTGLLVVARHPAAHACLGEAIRRREVKREYCAVVWGVMDDRGTIEAPVGRSSSDRTRMAVVNNGRHARSHYQLGEAFRFTSLLDVTLDTGRTHQIRVHFSHRNHALFGDPAYGGREKAIRGMAHDRRRAAAEALSLIDRQALHAARLGFPHPETGEWAQFEAPLPADMQALIQFLRQERDGP